MAEWINVKDRLPEYGDKPVAVFCGKDYGLAKYANSTDDWLIQPFSDALYQSKDCVTHWMPLPEPPMKQKQQTIVVDIRVNGERVDVDGFAKMVIEAIRAAMNPEKEKQEERRQALKRLKENQY